MTRSAQHLPPEHGGGEMSRIQGSQFGGHRCAARSSTSSSRSPSAWLLLRLTDSRVTAADRAYAGSRSESTRSRLPARFDASPAGAFACRNATRSSIDALMSQSSMRLSRFRAIPARRQSGRRGFRQRHAIRRWRAGRRLANPQCIGLRNGTNISLHTLFASGTLNVAESRKAPRFC